MTSTASFLVTFDGSPLPADVTALLTSAYVDDSLRLPDSFMLRFRDPGRIVVDKSKVRMGTKVMISVATDSTPTPEPLISGEVTALEAEFDNTGTFTVIRGFDPTHRLFRGRHTDILHADHRLRRGHAGGPARGADTGPGRVHHHRVRPPRPGRPDRLGVPRHRRPSRRIRAEDARGQIRLRRAPAGREGPVAVRADHQPARTAAGHRPAAVPGVVTAAEQVAKVEVRGWDVAQKRKIVSTVPAATTTVELPTLTPKDMAKTFGDPDLRRHRCRLPHPVGGGLGRRRAGRADRRRVRRVRGRRPRQPQTARRRQRSSIDNVGAPFDGKYTITTSRHRYDVNSAATPPPSRSPAARSAASTAWPAAAVAPPAGSGSSSPRSPTPTIRPAKAG